MARLAVLDPVAGQLSLPAVSGIGETPARTDEIGNRHPFLERVFARYLHSTVHVDDLRRIAGVRLQTQLVQHRLNDAITAGGQVGHHDLVTRQQRDVGCRSRRLQGSREIGRHYRDVPVGRQLAPDQEVVQVRVRLQIVDRVNHVAQVHALAKGIVPRSEHVSGQSDTGIQRRLQAGNTQHIAVAQRLRLRAGTKQSDLQNDPALVVVDTSQHRLDRIGLRRETTRQHDEIRHRGLVLDFVDGGTMDLARGSDRGADRRDKNDIALLELVVVGGVTADQQIVQVESSDQYALALELDGAHRADRLDAASGIEGGSHRRQAADRVGARPAGLTQYEDPDRTGVSHRHAGAHPYELSLDARLNAFLDGVESLTGDVYRPELGEADPAVAANRQPDRAILAAIELHT